VALAMNDPLGLLDPFKAGITCEQFCQECEKVRQASELRLLADKDKHPIILAQSGVKAERGLLTRLFGPAAFIECLMKMALAKLSFHGTPLQAELTSLVKVNWLLLYLRWQFETSRREQIYVASSKPGQPRTQPQRAGGSRFDQLTWWWTHHCV